MIKQINRFLEYNPQLDRFTDGLRHFVVHNGIYAPMLLLMLEESGIPLPIPGDVYIAVTGYLVSKGTIAFIPAFLALLCSVLVGASILFYISSKYGQIIVLKFGKYIHLDEKKLLLVEEKFRKYGVFVIIFGRHIPGFRVPITVFSGMSGISYKKFILSTFVSVIFWILFYLALGEKLGKDVFKLLYGHNAYLVVFVIPFLLFILSIAYIHFKNRTQDKSL